MMDIKNIRKKFPIISDDFIYFDTAATSQKPSNVIERLCNFYSKEYATVHRGIYDLSANSTRLYDEAREKIAKFINAKKSSEIIFTKGCTDSINLVAKSLENILEEDDEIIISMSEHHSNFVPWQMLSKKKKIKLNFIPVNENGEIIFSEFENMLSSRTKLVAIAHVSNATGIIHPIQKIIEKAHEKKALVLIDGAQAVSHLKVDVIDLDCDFYAFSSHKMYGPTGVGVLYGKYSILEKLPPVNGGGDMIEKVSISEVSYQKPPLKFEAGTPGIAEVIGFSEAISFIESIGVEKIFNYEKKLLEYLSCKIKTIENLKIIGDVQNKGPILSFIIENIHPLDIASFLNIKNIAIRSGHHCAQPLLNALNLNSTCRVSLGIYNTFDEIDSFVEILKEFTQNWIK